MEIYLNKTGIENWRLNIEPVMEAHMQKSRLSNSPYGQIVRRSIYKTRQPDSVYPILFNSRCKHYIIDSSHIIRVTVQSQPSSTTYTRLF